jgi:hypothetical protein
MLTAGCSDDESSTATSPPSSPVATPSESPSTTAPAEPTPTEDGLPFPDVAPATGVVVKGQTVQVNAPDEWLRSPVIADFSDGAYAQGDASLVLTDLDALGDGNLPDLTLEERGAVLLEGAEKMGGDYERQPDLVLDGVPVVRISGTNSGGLQEVQVSIERDQRLISLTIEASTGILERTPGLFESVLNTWTWR